MEGYKLTPEQEVRSKNLIKLQNEISNSFYEIGKAEIDLKIAKDKIQAKYEVVLLDIEIYEAEILECQKKHFSDNKEVDPISDEDCKTK